MCTIIMRTSRVVGGTERHRKIIGDATFSPSVQPRKNTKRPPRKKGELTTDLKKKMFLPSFHTICILYDHTETGGSFKDNIATSVNSKMIYSFEKK